jgi:hypothetical protein
MSAVFLVRIALNNYAGSERAWTAYGYQWFCGESDMIAGLHRSIEMVRIQHYEFNTVNCVSFFSDSFYNKDAWQAKDKTLYILKSDFAVEPDLQGAYPYKYKLVDLYDYMNGVSKEKEGIVYLLVSRDAPAALYLIDPSNHNTIGYVPKAWKEKRRSKQTIDSLDVKLIANLIAKKDSTSSEH